MRELKLSIDDTINAVYHLFQSVDILSVVSQQFVVFFNGPYESVARRGLELARVDFSGKLEERAGVFAKVVDVEHGLE